jgi:hypothetical protein
MNYRIACYMIPRLIFFSIFLLFLATGQNASAQMRVEASSAEDVAIAFFKTANTNPDFELWAKSTQEFKTIAPARVNDYMFRETQRLMRLWQKYDTQEPIIDIKANVLLEVKATADKDGNQFYWMYISFGKDDAVYFPYKFQEYKIAVIPQMIETMMIQPLQKEQYEMIVQEFEGKATGNGTMYMQLKPVKAYIHQPYKIDNEDQWALLSDVATMSIKSVKTNTPYWTYSADWYTSPVTEELQDLYQTPSQGVAQ